MNAVVTLATQLGVRLVVGLGAFPAPAPHTRPVRLAATAPRESADLVARVGIVQGEIDVPSGVWGALELAFGEAGIPTVGLWARVPHYVSGMAFPSASAALIDGLAAVGDLSVDSTELHTAADASLQQVDELIAKSAEHTSMVRQLERSVDAAEGNPLEWERSPPAMSSPPSSNAIYATSAVTAVRPKTLSTASKTRPSSSSRTGGT